MTESEQAAAVERTLRGETICENCQRAIPATGMFRYKFRDSRMRYACSVGCAQALGSGLSLLDSLISRLEDVNIGIFSDGTREI
jgi:hypothetical protein